MRTARRLTGSQKLVWVAGLIWLMAARADPADLKPLTFLPEVERVMDGNGALGARVYLDFETGEVTAERLREDPERNRRLHRDLKLDLTPGSEEWTGIGLEIAPAREEHWNEPADQVVAAMKDDLAPPLATMQVTPGLWFFKTADGKYGLMRIEGLVQTHPGDKAMQLVYKLAATSPAAGTETNAVK